MPVSNKDVEIVFQSVNIIPMNTETVLYGQDVVIKNGKIASLGKHGEVKYDKSAIVIDCRNKYLLPGLAEMHAHIPHGEDLQPMEDVLSLFVINGVTTVRGMQGHPTHLVLREKIQQGEIVGPRFYTAGPALNGYNLRIGGGPEKIVREQKKSGYDFLKLTDLTLDDFNAIVKTANEVNISFAGHVTWDVGIWRAIDAKYSSIEHLEGFIEGLVREDITEEEVGFYWTDAVRKADTLLIPKLIRGLREHSIAVVPTQSLFERMLSAKRGEELRKEPEMIYVDAETLNGWVGDKNSIVDDPMYHEVDVKRVLEFRRKLIYACHRGGVTLLMGSDAPQIFNVPGFSLHHELQYLVESGLTPYEALQTGTVNVARFFSQEQSSGTIEEGNVSDLVLLSSNPLEDIKALKSIDGVMLGENWLSGEYLMAEKKRLTK